MNPRLSPTSLPSRGRPHIIGGAAGIGRLAAAAMEGIARQPNAAGDIRGAMIVAAGLIEGVTFFSLIVTILLAIK